MGWLSCGRDAVSDRLGVVEGAVSAKRPGPVSYPCPLIRGDGDGAVSANPGDGDGAVSANRGTGDGPCPISRAWTGGRRRVR
jgi:hypothetical protein